MKNMADFKRWLKPGKEMTLIEHSYGHKDINLCRKVITVQTNCFSMLGSNGKESWLSYPKSKQVSFDGNIMTIFEDDFKMVYRLENE